MISRNSLSTTLFTGLWWNPLSPTRHQQCVETRLWPRSFPSRPEGGAWIQTYGFSPFQSENGLICIKIHHIFVFEWLRSKARFDRRVASVDWHRTTAWTVKRRCCLFNFIFNGYTLKSSRIRTTNSRPRLTTFTIDNVIEGRQRTRRHSDKLTL